MPLLMDKIILALLIIFSLFGWFRGFLKALIGPLSCALCFFFAAIFYDLNQNILLASLIAVGGTIALATIFSTILTIGMATVNKEFRGKIFLLSRILGSGVNLLWQGNLLFLSLIIMTALPAAKPGVEKLQDQIYQSKMVESYYRHVISPDDRLQAGLASLAIFKDHEQMDRVSKTKEFQAFQQDPKVQAFLSDPKVLEAAGKKDTLAILMAPSLAELITNDRAMEKFTTLVKLMYRENLGRINPSKKETPRPDRL